MTDETKEGISQTICSISSNMDEVLDASEEDNDESVSVTAVDNCDRST